MLRYFKRVSQISNEENVEAKKQRIEEISIEENVEAKEASGKDATVGENDKAKEASIDDTNFQENDEVKKASIEHIDVAQLPTDPGLRTPILDYNVNLRDQIRRACLQRGPCQPRSHVFPRKKSRRFIPAWFNEYSDWLEYSISKNTAFCLYCYLFGPNNGEQGGGDAFVKEGFHNFKKKDRLGVHVGDVHSAHNQARRNCEALMNQEQHIETVLFKQSKRARSAYRIRLNASIDCIRLLLRQGLAFRGHDECEESNNQGNFLEQLKFLADHNEKIKAVTLKNAPKNHKLTSPKIQKDIVSAGAIEMIDVIIKDIDDTFFSILVDESQDISVKEQMSVVLCYVDKTRHVVERFIGIEHVSSTTALSFKAAIDKLFSRYGLSISRLRGQGYDGASNMQGEFKGLKTLILKENPSAFYVHCFAHQLQLALVAMAKKHKKIPKLFNLVSSMVNIVGASSKRCDILREKQEAIISEALINGEISSGRGLNQQSTIARFGDTRWGSHYRTLVSLILMFSPIIDVIEMISIDGSTREQRCDADNLLDSMQSFEFVFNLHLMRTILGISNELSMALQRKDQDIVNAMSLVTVCKQRLQEMRDNEWDSFLDEVISFCQKHNIDVPDMDSVFVRPGRSRRNTEEMTNFHRFRVDLFYSVIDMQLQELNDRFSEVSTELLLCLACLCPDDSFSAFDKDKLIRLAKYYPKDFSKIQLMTLDDQLRNYIVDMRSNKEFRELKGLSELALKLVETKRNKVYPLVYMLVTLGLTLPVATASVERVFSAMNIAKNRLRNQIGDQWMNDSLVVYVEKDVFNEIDNKTIIRRFQSMRSRKEQL
ncbi:zinc finger MYM-type protein 1-like [Olea europaea var. sylvestris]|uniref:zinc finger MYM-type protein 1-like n=1 Tax=Olea europaea var. sylvestris TaxID=158386 RepID=UPI000C1D4D9A|nr:zinc finger MYM-type protein 1-like [Olea europaea var. sylvestris]